MMSIKTKLSQIKTQIPDHVTLVAVSKTKPVEDLMQAYDCGQRIFEKTKFKKWLRNTKGCLRTYNGI